MKKFLVLGMVLLVFATTLAACTPKEEVVYIEGEERDLVAAQAEPFLQNILSGIANSDYALFTKDFDEGMLKAMTETQFESIVKTMGKLEQPQSYELSNVVDKVEFYGVNYKVTYVKAVVNILLVLPKQEPRLVSGLWFK